MLAFLKNNSGDMVERGIIMAAIIVAAVFLWNQLGQKLADKLSTVNSAIGN